MKKNSLIQLAVICFGIAGIYAAATFIIPVISAAFTTAFGDAETRNYFQLSWLISFILYFIFGFIMINKSGDISNWISERSAMDDNLKIFTKTSHLLSIFIVILALGRLLDSAPKLLQDIYVIFVGLGYRQAQATNGLQGFPDLFTNMFNAIVACLLIIFCKQITAYFSKNILLGEDEMVIEHETITIETIDSQEEI